nr:hypothetical protein [Vibrio parahaemolyticus]
MIKVACGSIGIALLTP